MTSMIEFQHGNAITITNAERTISNLILLKHITGLSYDPDSCTLNIQLISGHLLTFPKTSSVVLNKTLQRACKL